MCTYVCSRRKSRHFQDNNSCGIKDLCSIFHIYNAILGLLFLVDRQQTNHMKYQALFDSLKKGVHLELFAVAVFCGFLRVCLLVALRMKMYLLYPGLSFVTSFISVNLVREGGTYGELYLQKSIFLNENDRDKGVARTRI